MQRVVLLGFVVVGACEPEAGKDVATKKNEVAAKGDADAKGDRDAKSKADAKSGAGKKTDADADAVAVADADADAVAVADADAVADAVADPAPATKPVRALALLDGKLVRLAPDGATEVVVAAPGANACDDDDAHRVVWLATNKELSAFDPTDGKVHAVATGFKANDDLAWRIGFTDGKDPDVTVTAGNADGLMHCVALAIDVADKPRMSAEVIADGDNTWNCMDGDGDGGITEGKLNPDEAKVQRAYAKAKLADAAFLVALDARRKKDGPRERPALVAPTAPKPAVDPKRCEEDETRCGEAEYVGGSRLWWVIVSNGRGDFYHENRALFDATGNEFWDPSTDARSKDAPAGTEANPLKASPDGSWGVYEGKIVSLADAKVTGAFAGTVCGWE